MKIYSVKVCKQRDRHHLSLSCVSHFYLGSIPIISHIHIHTISDEIQDNFRKSQKGLLLFEPLPSLLEIFTDVEKNWQTNQFTSLLEFFVCVYRGGDLCDTNQGHRGRRGYGRFAPIHLNTASIPSNTLQYGQYWQYGSNTAATNTAIDLGTPKIALPAIASTLMCASTEYWQPIISSRVSIWIVSLKCCVKFL